ncbi:MAG: hypothetical protein ABL955_13860, partial [Elusimicrobiota bacterium]
MKRVARALPFAILAVLLGAPLMRLALASFSLEGGGWSLDGWRETLALEALPRAALNTLVVAVVASALATGAGGLAALLVARARPHGGAWAWRAAFAAPMLLSQSVLAAAWAALAEQASLTVRLNVYGLTGLCLVCAACVLPAAFLILEAAFSRQDPALDEIAAVCGARPARILRCVTLPLAGPSLTAAALLS